MPIAPAIIAAIIGAAATAGTTAYGAISSSNAADDAKKAAEKQQAELTAEQKAQAEKDAQAQQAQRQQLLRRAAPDAQAQTGGALTGNPLDSLIAQIAGQPDSAQQPFFSGTGVTPGGSGSQSIPGFDFGGGSSSNPGLNLHDLSQSLQGGQVGAS